MVVLSKILVKDFQDLGFKNKSKGIAFVKGILETKANKFKTNEDLINYLKPQIK